MLALRRLPSLARVAARPQIASLGTTGACKEKQLPWQLYRAPRRTIDPQFKVSVRGRPFLYIAKPGRPTTAPFVQYCCQKRDVVIRASAQFPPRAPADPRTPSTRRSDPRRGAHPFSSFEKTLQGREAVEENLYIRDKEAAAKYKREAELQAERLADASKAFKKEFSQELATMLHQKHLAERQKALRK